MAVGACHTCRAKQAISQPKTAHFAAQNGPFRDVIRAILQRTVYQRVAKRGLHGIPATACAP